MRRWGTLLVMLGALSALAQVVPEREVELARQLYEVGKFGEALKRATDAMALTNFADDQRVRLHEIAGMSAFNLGDLKAAQTHFLQLLQINPDFQLDPFAVPPPAIKLFEQVRKDSADALALVRAQLALRAEQQRREAAERERQRVAEEEQRRRAEQLAQRVTVRTVEKHPFLLNFLPFGTGQFLEGRVGLGVVFAVSEAVLAITSIISWFAINALYETTTQTLCCYLTADGTGKVTFEVRTIPQSRHADFKVWSILKYASGGAFYGAWAAGIIDAIINHTPQTVNETQDLLKPSVQLNLSPGGGLGASLTWHF